MCCLRNIAMRNQESVTTGQTDRQTHTHRDAGQSDPYVPLCFAGNTKIPVLKIDLKLIAEVCLQVNYPINSHG